MADNNAPKKRGRPPLTEEEKKQRAAERASRPPVPADNRPAFGKGGKYNFPNARMQLLEQDDEKRAFVAKAVENNLVFFNKGVYERVHSDEELCERLNWFFSECARTQQIPNIEKMSNALGYHNRTVLDWENGRLKGFSPVTGEIIKQAKQILASIDAELAQEGKSQPVVYMFRAKNFYGMRDQQDFVLTPNTRSVDTETIEAKYAELPED
jgi:hypothetical protein